jgi:hypothetical protein
MSKPKKVSPSSSLRPTWLIPVGLGVLAVAVILVVLLTSNSTRPGSTTTFPIKVTNAPAAEVDQSVVDHGSVSFNTPVESVFRVRNVGDKPLLIFGEPEVELVEGC